MFKDYITFKHIKGDFFGGITAGIVALPLAMAFGEQSGLGAAAGLFGAIAIGFFASLFCSTQQQISGPTAPMTAVSVVVVSQIIQSFNGDIATAMPSILMVFFLAGVFQVLLGIIGVGKYIKYIPYPVISGFMNGIAIIILMGQIFPLMGYVADKDQELVEKNRIVAESNLIAKQFQSIKKDKTIGLDEVAVIEKNIAEIKKISKDEIVAEAEAVSKMQVKTPAGIIKNINRGLKNINWLEFTFVVSTVIVIYGFKYVLRWLPSRIKFFDGLKKIASSIPATLIALVIMSTIAIYGEFDLLKIQEIPIGFPTMHLEIFSGFSFDAIKPFLMAAVSLAMLGSIDSLLTSVIVDTKEKTQHNSSQELVSQGIGNSMAALFGGIPGSSATIRTLVNMNSGGVTRLSGIFASLLLLVILIFFAPIASKIPAGVLAGVLITVGIGIFDYRGLKAIKKMPIWDVVVMIVVMLLTVFVDLVIAVGVGLVISALIFMKKMGDINTKRSTVTPLDITQELPWEDEKEISEDISKKVFVKRLEGPLFFGYTNDLQQLYTHIPEEAEYIILRMDKVPYVDQSGLYTLEDIIIDLENKGKCVLVVGLQKQPDYLIRKIEIIPNLVAEHENFKTFDQCLIWLHDEISKCYEN
ncbi:SulP family inorganic anion transporter [Chryseobacterium oryctis]|uniref:SulP family inorganic anion transporter n=1 Tax=Chryseobacterium oryctis TaxID=2952618 RepID=A0ABT3HQJ1_9FLAO|nr:SulP family inorganic anion transporter [Chryseobacterium oryctis]MCW3162054.1 SulP family inorganic anion transporter [Chryseobacterium oryctis]